MQVKIK